MARLAYRVLYNACLQNKRWQDAGLDPIIVSVNYSVIQFLQSDMIQELARVLQETGSAADIIWRSKLPKRPL